MLRQPHKLEGSSGVITPVMDTNPGPRQAPTWDRTDTRKDMMGLWQNRKIIGKGRHVSTLLK